MGRPVRPEFFGYPPQTSAPTASAPAGYPAHLHHRRPVTPPKAGRARSPSQHRRRRKGDRPRRTRQGRREDEEVRPAEVRPAEIRPAEVHPAESPSAAEPARASDAAPPPTTERDEKAMFQLVLQSSRDELSRQLYQAIGGHDATAFFKDGLSALQAYMLFVLHYLENYLTTAGLHAWPVISHNNLRSMTDRVAFTKTFSRPWKEIQGSEVAEVVQFLISQGLLINLQCQLASARSACWPRHSLPVRFRISKCLCAEHKNTLCQKRRYMCGSFLCNFSRSRR